MQYKELYEKGKKRLEMAEIEEASLDARLLLEYACGTDRNTLLVYPEREVVAESSTLYEEYIEKRAKRIPLQHIMGEQSFMGLQFFVNEHVLIPRQDTEILTEEVLKHLHDGMHILDMCTGSGCILLSLLKYSNDCLGTGADISEEALAVARKNANRLEQQAVFIKSDLFKEIEGRFDIIVSNPPYIKTEVIPTLAKEVKEHDPMLALDGKEDGLFFYREIVSQAGGYLQRGGQLFFEIGCEQAKEVSKLLTDNGYKEVTVKKDYAGLDRVVYGVYLP